MVSYSDNVDTLELSDEESEDDIIISVQVKAEEESVVEESTRVEEEEDSSRYRLPPMLAVAFACVLEDAIDKITIVGNMGGLPKVEVSMEIETLEQRFGKKELGGQVFDPETIEPIAIALEHQKLTKFQKDRVYIKKILEEAQSSLSTKNTFECIVKAMEKHDQVLAEEAQLLEEAKENRKKVHHLEVLYETEKSEAARDILEKMEEIGKLKDEIEKIIFENGIKMRYIDKWENARVEQNLMKLEEKEEYYQTTIKTTNIEIERETRINAEIEAFVSEKQKEYEDAIQEWMERYDSELERLDMEMQVLGEKQEELEKRHQELKQLYQEHKRFIEYWLDHCEKKRVAAERRRAVTDAALTIQCWWRGVLVRKRLGPFAKKKGKGGAAKKK